MKFVQSSDMLDDGHLDYLFCIVRGPRAYEKSNSWWSYPSEGYLTDFELEFVIDNNFPSDEIPF